MPTWSGIRKKLEKEYLAPSLHGRIQYFATSYSKCPDHEGRASVRLDGEEVLKSSYYEFTIAQWNAEETIDTNLPNVSLQERWQMVHQMTLNEGEFDQHHFYTAFQEFDNQNIEVSLSSHNPLVRMFSLLDRRIGKRKLISLKDKMKDELNWLQFFYLVRLEAEGIVLSVK